MVNYFEIAEKAAQALEESRFFSSERLCAAAADLSESGRAAFAGRTAGKLPEVLELEYSTLGQRSIDRVVLPQANLRERLWDLACLGPADVPDARSSLPLRLQSPLRSVARASVADTTGAASEIAGAPQFSSYDRFLEELEASGRQNIALPEILQGTKLGSGRVATVYEVPGINSYAFRVFHDSRFNPLHLYRPVKLVADPLPQLNYGQAVAEMGRDIEIIKLQPGTRFVDEETAKTTMGWDQKKIESHGLEMLRQAVDLPQESYDGLADLLAQLNGSRLGWDCKSANLLLVPKSALNIVDVHGKEANHGGMIVSAMFKPVRTLGLQSIEPDLARGICEMIDNACQKTHLPKHSSAWNHLTALFNAADS